MIQVLIVEDDPMVAHLNTRYVESIEGFSVIGHVVNGEDALEFCKKNVVDLIILDIYMPKMNGVEFISELRKAFILIDIIVVTASKETKIIDTMFKLGTFDYLIKPFEYERFKKSLDNYLEKHQFMSSTKNIHQEELDRLTNVQQKGNTEYLAKGLHKNTLERILRFYKTQDQGLLNSEELAEALDLSKVTIRRYMDYLESIGQVKIEIQYGTIGRPSNMYRYIKE